MMNRRTFFLSSAGLAAFAGLGLSNSRRGTAHAAEGNFEVTKSDAEWRKELTDAQYRILRQEGTEAPFSSPLLKEKRAGLYHCTGCDLPIYSSETKFHSGTGWPSFYESISNAVRTKTDTSLFAARTEVHCRRCGGHLGHIFDDGPKPTGKRHCIDGVALTFTPKAAA